MNDTGTDNLDFAYAQIEDTSKHTFLTGDAGTGKSTLIKRFMAEHEGEYVALAPTGIAAVNISGQTIHSFFKFPAHPVNFESIKKLDTLYDYDLIKVWERIKYLIIDEVSMVRADMMDQIHYFCIKNFPTTKGLHLPFAGKKLIMVGDIDQLPPVVASDEEKTMMKNRYRSEFFFSANCWKDHKYFPDPFAAPFEVVRLTKVWRQSDPRFVELLNNIKNNRVSSIDIDRLNNTTVRDGILDPKDGIMLCTINSRAAEINSYMIDKIEGESMRVEGRFEDDFPIKDAPVEPVLHLKPGCRVMTMRNSNDPDNAYFNGSIGTYIETREMEVPVESKGGIAQSTGIEVCLILKMDDETEVHVPRYTFENVKFVYDEKTDRIKHTVVGTFVQFPIKLAYAMTIHKSQGQTFDKVIIDLGRGAFEHGQAYVALSRCRSLEGIIMLRPLSVRDLIYKEAVLDFNSKQKV